MFESWKTTGKFSATFVQSVLSRCACNKRLLLLKFVTSLNLQVINRQN